RAGLITLQILGDPQQSLGALEAREAFLRGAVPLLHRGAGGATSGSAKPATHEAVQHQHQPQQPQQPQQNAQSQQAASTATAPVAAAPPVAVADASTAAPSSSSMADALSSMSAVGEISVHSPTQSASAGHVVYCVTYKVDVFAAVHGQPPPI